MSKAVGSHIVTSITEQMTRMGIERLADDPRNIRWRIQCSAKLVDNCERDRLFNWGPAPSVDAAPRLISRAKWRVLPHGTYECSQCAKAKRSPKVCHMAGSSDAIDPANNVIPMKGTPLMQPSPAPKPDHDPKLMRKVYNLLDDHFNETTRLYDEGWNDAKIAEAVELSEVAIAKIRVAAYGELADDPKLVALRSEIVALRAQLTADTAALRDLYNEQLKKLEARVQAIIMGKG